jgi:tetratricopeptide (TPR) repeat protein
MTEAWPAIVLALGAAPCLAQSVARFPDVPPTASSGAMPAPVPRRSDSPEEKQAPVPVARTERPRADQSARSWAVIAAEQLIGRGEEYERRGDPMSAFGAYFEALRMDPGSGKAYLGLGRLRELAGDVDEAERCYTAAARFEKTAAEALALRARLHRRLGHRSEASRDLAGSLLLDPGAASRWNELGQWYVEENAWPAALALYRRWLAESNPSSDEHARLKLQVTALTVLAAEADPVTAGAEERTNWVRRSLARIARIQR